MSSMHDLGRQVAALQDADRVALGAADLAGERFIRAVRKRSRRAPPRHLLLAAIVGLAAVVVFVWFGTRPPASPAPLAVTPAFDVGDAIRAPADQTIPLRFSDGSKVLLSSGTEAVVRELTADGARLDLTRGKAQVSVQHRAQAQWSLRAGPYSIEVTGTRFDLAWSPDSQRLALDLEEGAVRVSTERSDHAAVKMVAPERLVIDEHGWHLSHSGGDSDSPIPSAAPAPAASAPVPSPAANSPARSTAAPDETPAADWQTLSRRGAYRDAYDAARAQGIATIAQSGSSSQLFALAETCRLSGHGREAVAVLSRLRARFANSEEAAVAAFQLGRVTGGGAASAKWFRTYLSERPGGKLAREASGRLLEALHRSGNSSEARAAAKRYLDRYPSGPHGDFAKRILGE